MDSNYIFDDFRTFRIFTKHRALHPLRGTFWKRGWAWHDRVLNILMRSGCGGPESSFSIRKGKVPRSPDPKGNVSRRKGPRWLPDRSLIDQTDVKKCQRNHFGSGKQSLNHYFSSIFGHVNELQSNTWSSIRDHADIPFRFTPELPQVALELSTDHEEMSTGWSENVKQIGAICIDICGLSMNSP